MVEGLSAGGRKGCKSSSPHKDSTGQTFFEINFQPWKCQGYLTINSRTIRRLADMQKQLIQISWRFSGYRPTDFFCTKNLGNLKVLS